MKFAGLLALLGGTTLFDASVLLAAPERPAEVRRQLSRWVATGRLIQLRRGLYALAPPFARTSPSLLAVASRLRRPSYVSLQSALSYHGAIPESVPVVTSVTTARPGRLDTQLGEFIYRHVHPRWFWGYREENVGDGDRASIALPEKALLDLFCLTPGSTSAPFVRELRLAPDTIDTRRLQRFAERMGRPKAIRAAAVASRVLREEDDRGKS